VSLTRTKSRAPVSGVGGFVSDDRKRAHCTRDDFAGGLTKNPKTSTYTHRLEGTCKCGRQHGPAIPVSHSTNGKSPSTTSRTEECRYSYVDENGNLLFQSVRFRPKRFKQCRPDGKGGDFWNLDKTRRVLYHLSQLLAADTEATVFIPEGEKDVERLERLGLVSTCNPMGAKKWTAESEYSGPLEGRNVVLLEDNDKDGREHVEKVASALRGPRRRCQPVVLL
jgi:hypothetical protein